MTRHELKPNTPVLAPQDGKYQPATVIEAGIRHPDRPYSNRVYARLRWECGSVGEVHSRLVRPRGRG